LLSLCYSNQTRPRELGKGAAGTHPRPVHAVAGRRRRRAAQQRQRKGKEEGPGPCSRKWTEEENVLQLVVLRKESKLERDWSKALFFTQNKRTEVPPRVYGRWMDPRGCTCRLSMSKRCMDLEHNNAHLFRAQLHRTTSDFNECRSL